MSDKEVRADAKLKNLPADVLDTLWRLRNPEEDGEKLTLEAVLVELKNTQGIEVSISTLSEFYKWLRFKRRMESGRRITDQVMEQMRRDPSMTLDQMHAAAQFVFTNATMDEDDPKTYIALAKLSLQRDQQSLDREKMTAATRNKIDAGLDALFEEIKGNPRAEKLFAELREVVSKA